MKSTWFHGLIAILITWSLLTSGCARLPWTGETISTTDPPIAGTQRVFESNGPTDSPTRPSLFFNEKSHEIEASLGL